MKTCTKCHVEKPESDYFVRDGKTGRLHAQCKACYTIHRINYSAAHCQKYGDAYRSRAKIRRAAIKKVLQNAMTEYLLDKACETCGENDPRVLDFDHITPSEKKFGISNGITKGMPWDTLLVEIKKCRILCANCHRKHTATQQRWYRTVNQ